MSLSSSFGQATFTNKSEVFSAIFLLKRGLNYLIQGRYAEGAAIFTLAREQLSPDQIHLATALDVFTQSYEKYWQAQQSFYQANRSFIEAEAEHQSQVATLIKLLPMLIDTLTENTRFIEIQPLKKTHSSPSFLPLPENFNTYQTQQSPEPLSGGQNSLPALYCTCFGRFEVRRLEQSIPLCSNRSGQSILRFLIAKWDHCATSDMLQTLLWPEDQPEVALNKLHIAISALRRSLNQGYICEPSCGYIVYKNRTYYLNPEVVVRTDVDDFLMYYQAGQQANERKIPLYEKACGFYTGAFLTEDIYADWSFLRREELSRIYLSMCRALADYSMQNKLHERAVQWTTAILKENACDEAAHRQLMRIYAAQGYRSEALQQYQRCKLILLNELGVQPLPETEHLFQALLANELSSHEEYEADNI